jgi:hypothetical protein
MYREPPGYDSSHVYRPSGFWRFFMLVLGMIAIAAGGLGTWYFGTGHEEHGTGQLILSAFCLAFLAMGIYLVAFVTRTRLTLRQGEIELAGIASARSLRRDEILGFRTYAPRNGPPILVLVPRSDDARKLKIPQMFRTDQAFRDWLGGLPDLDARDADAVEKQIESRTELGATPEERSRTVEQAKWICRLLTIATIAVSIWGFLYPAPYAVVVALLVSLPWAAVAVTARYPGLVIINQDRRDPRPGTAVPFIFPGLVLTLRIVNDARPIGWEEPLALTLLLAGGLTLAAWRVDVTLRRRPPKLLLILLLACFYGYGSVMEADILFDRTPPAVYRTVITGKYISNGKSKSYNLRLAPWGPKTNGDRVSVPRTFYLSKQIGDPVCVSLRPGTLAIPWYIVRDCL